MKAVNITIIKKYEGCELEAYLCPANIWTIGYGHTGGVKEGDEVTQEEAEALLREDLEHAEYWVNESVTAPLRQVQFDALVSLVFNIGSGNFRKSTLLKKLNLRDYEGAAEEFPKWRKAGGKVLRGLELRRAEEKELFECGTS